MFGERIRRFEGLPYRQWKPERMSENLKKMLNLGPEDTSLKKIKKKSSPPSLQKVQE